MNAIEECDNHSCAWRVGGEGLGKIVKWVCARREVWEGKDLVELTH